jgi:hypothetical protein
MGELEVELVETQSLIRTRVLRVVAKVASQPAAPHLEQAALLGMNFIFDNRLRQELDATGPNASGYVWAA